MALQPSLVEHLTNDGNSVLGALIQPNAQARLPQVNPPRQNPRQRNPPRQDPPRENPRQQNPPREDPPQEHAQPNTLAELMELLFGGAFHDHEDERYVRNQQEFDDIMDELMEEDRMRDAPQPAPADEIASLPLVALTKAMQGDKEIANCSICMEKSELGEFVTLMHCDHWFHEECITAWLNEHNTCPNCRKSISQGLEEAVQRNPARLLEGVSGACIPDGVLPPPRVPPRADGLTAAPLVRFPPEVVPGPAAVREPAVERGPHRAPSLLRGATGGRLGFTRMWNGRGH